MSAKWMPGQPRPPYLDGSTPGMDSEALKRMPESFQHQSKNEARNGKPTNIGATRKLDLKIVKAVNVSPARETFDGLYVLSNLDQTLPCTFELIFAFKGEGRERPFAAAEMLRDSLAEVLVEFYPFTGRLVMGSDEKMAVRCPGQGVPFVAAISEDEIGVLGDISSIDPPTLRKLVNHSDGPETIFEKPLLTVQVTTFNCGGIILGILMYHFVADGKALTDFMSCWTDVARARPLSIPPFLNRSVLCPRRFPRVDGPHHEYALRDRRSKCIVNPRTEPLVHRSFCFKPLTLIQLKKVSTITADNGSSIVPSSFEVMSALVWILRTKALGVEPQETAKLLIAVDIRPMFHPPLPSGYFGNGIVFSCAECRSSELIDKPFSFAVQTVREALLCVTDSYIRSAIDHIELNRVVVDCEGNTCCITKLSRLPFYSTDFGFGRPFQVAPATVSRNCVMISSQSEESDNSVLSLGLPRDAMDVFSKLIQPELSLKSKF